jgi:hypothetical protein
MSAEFVFSFHFLAEKVYWRLRILYQSATYGSEQSVYKLEGMSRDRSFIEMESLLLVSLGQKKTVVQTFLILESFCLSPFFVGYTPPAFLFS